MVGSSCAQGVRPGVGAAAVAELRCESRSWVRNSIASSVWGLGPETPDTMATVPCLLPTPWPVEAITPQGTPPRKQSPGRTSVRFAS